MVLNAIVNILLCRQLDLSYLEFNFCIQHQLKNF